MRTQTVTISGDVTAEDGTPMSSTVIQFIPSKGAERTVMSDDEGTYSIDLDPGSYSVICASVEGACRPADAGGKPSAAITATASMNVDFLVAMRASSSTTATRPPDQNGSARPTDICRAGGYTVCGFVTQNGRPVQGATIEAKFGNQNQTTATNDRGGYGLKLQIPVTTLICIEPQEMTDEHLDCRAVGAVGPVTVGSDESGRIVNFTIVSTQ